MDFKVTLWMIAYRTDLQSFCSDNNMTTVAALPYLNFALLKYLSSIKILKKRTISVFVVLFDFSYCSDCFYIFLRMIRLPFSFNH